MMYLEVEMANCDNCRYSLEFQVEVKVFYSAKGNSQYTLSPYRFPRTSLCTALESPIWKSSTENNLRKGSDLPERNGQQLCFAIKKVEVSQYHQIE